MPSLEVEIDALPRAVNVAGLCNIPYQMVTGGLVAMWFHCWKEGKDRVTAVQLRSFFGGSDVAAGLVDFGFLERVDGETFRVRGAQRYLRIKLTRAEAGSRGGKATAERGIGFKNLRQFASPATEATPKQNGLDPRNFASGISTEANTEANPKQTMRHRVIPEAAPKQTPKQTPEADHRSTELLHTVGSRSTNGSRSTAVITEEASSSLRSEDSAAPGPTQGELIHLQEARKAKAEKIQRQRSAQEVLMQKLQERRHRSVTARYGTEPTPEIYGPREANILLRGVVAMNVSDEAVLGAFDLYLEKDFPERFDPCWSIARFVDKYLSEFLSKWQKGECERMDPEVTQDIDPLMDDFQPTQAADIPF